MIHNPATNEYLVAMPGSVGGDIEAYVQRLNALGAQTGTDDQRISHMGPDLALDYGLLVDISAGFSPSGHYLVTCSGDTTSFGLVKDENEIFGQALDNAGAEIGDDLPISSMGPDGTPQYGIPGFQFTGPLAHAPGPDRFFVVWAGDNGPPLADDEFETWARMVAATPAPAPAAPPPAPKPGLKLMPDCVPVFATKERGRKGVRGASRSRSAAGSGSPCATRATSAATSATRSAGRSPASPRGGSAAVPDADQAGAQDPLRRRLTTAGSA